MSGGFFMGKRRGKGKQILLFGFTAVLVLSGAIWYTVEYTSVGNSVNGTEMPVCSVETEEKAAALTFEAAWDEDGTKKVLDILKDCQVQASFFVTGEWARLYPDTVKRIVKEGHDLGSLGETHQNMSRMTQKEQEEEIRSTHKTVEEEVGVKMSLFRPPYGRYGESLIRTARDLGYQTVCWSVDSMDWKDYGAEAVASTVLKDPELKNGAVIRLNSEAKYTPEALPKLIQGLQKEGYQLVPLSKLLYNEPYHLDVTGRQIQGLCERLFAK